MLLELQKSILYGPVNSRRLGRSLGINLMPQQYKLCSFNCVYCQYGWTRQWKRDARPFMQDLPAFETVVSDVKKALKSDLPFDYLTFSGNGEPTLYPHFPELVERIRELLDQYRPSTKLALLSNASGLCEDRIMNCLHLIDLPVLKLDAGTKTTFHAINHPAPGIDFDEMIQRMKDLSGFYIQTALINGNPTNTTPQELAAYYALIKGIRPEKVHIYSIERNYPHDGIFVVPGDDLERIAAEGRQETGIAFIAFYRS